MLQNYGFRMTSLSEQTQNIEDASEMVKVCMCDKNPTYPYTTEIVKETSQVLEKQRVSLRIVTTLNKHSFLSRSHDKAVCSAQCERARIPARNVVDVLPQSLVENPLFRLH